jgi:hypothetical protein
VFLYENATLEWHVIAMLQWNNKVAKQIGNPTSRPEVIALLERKAGLKSAKGVLAHLKTPFCLRKHTKHKTRSELHQENRKPATGEIGQNCLELGANPKPKPVKPLELKQPQRAKNGFGCPLRILELARARPSLRCAPFGCSWCMGGIRCVTIYRFFGAEEMDFGLSEISNVEIRF